MDKYEQLNMSLEEKIQRSKELILEWYLHFDGKVYVSFSGGKDSTVLLHLARSIKGCENIPAVFCDTGLEYPEVRELVKTVDNVIWLKPKKTFKQVVENIGWPIISKEQAKYIHEIRNYTEYNKNRILSRKNFTLANKWRPLLDADFKISDRCCYVMKKGPAGIFERRNGMHPIVGTMASESALRRQQYLKSQCNMYSAKHPVSRPLSFWTEQDVLRYILKYDLKIPSVYGDIVEEDGKLKTTMCDRTGCMFCMFGLHMEKGENRFDRMKKTHPQLYTYIMDKLGGRHVMETYLKHAKKKKEKVDEA